jgi:hypothetical protein
MGPKKIKKLVLKQETISTLSDESMSSLLGGYGSGHMQCTTTGSPCTGYQDCNTGTCVSIVASGTGYGMCCCGTTNYCTP